MQYRPYGKQGYDVSLFGMGCMRFPRIEKDDGTVVVDLEKSYELVRYAVDHGVNYFDTAYGYHSQQSEAVLGEALRGRREKVKIATKQPFGVMKTQADIRINLENTLKKLQTDYIDVYLIHCIDASSWEGIKERNIIAEFEKFKQEGLIKAIAFSYHGDFPLFKEVLGSYDWAMAQVQQNLLDSGREVTEEGIRLVGEKGAALVIMEPLRGGGLASGPKDILDVYASYPVKRSPAEWAFRYLIDYPEVSSILSGVTTMEQLKDNIRIFSQEDARPHCLRPEERKILANAKACYDSRVTIPCTGCEYCLPCPQGVNIPGVFSRYNDGVMFDHFDNVRRSYSFMQRGGRDASQCVACGACEPQCPQNISIIRQLQVADSALSGWKE